MHFLYLSILFFSPKPSCIVHIYFKSSSTLIPKLRNRTNMISSLAISRVFIDNIQGCISPTRARFRGGAHPPCWGRTPCAGGGFQYNLFFQKILKLNVFLFVIGKREGGSRKNISRIKNC